MSVVTRFAPSPTGFLHIGGARTALFSYLYAKRHGGRFVLRVEDTDRERSTQAAVDAILEGMQWLGLKSDVEPIYQTQRIDRYRELIEELLAAGKAYRCYASKQELDQLRAEQQAQKRKPRYDGRWRPEPGKSLPPPPEGVSPVIRFRNPLEGEVVLEDLIKGPIRFSNAEMDDLIIARADGTPTYNFCVVVDDMDMGITHVVRGDDHVNNTPRQINILKALGATPPQYAHVSMILGADGAKLSKRHGALGVMEYRAMGFMPEALCNYLVRLGWSHGDQELFSRQEMIEKFDFDHVTPSAARFDMEKAHWVNQQYLKATDPALIAPELEWHLRRIGLDPMRGPNLEKVIEQYRDRCKTLVEMAEKARPYFSELPADPYDAKDAAKHLSAETGGYLQVFSDRLSEQVAWNAEAIEATAKAVCAALDIKLGKLAQPTRVALIGKAVSPPLGITLELMNRTRTLARLKTAIEYAQSRSLTDSNSQT